MKTYPQASEILNIINQASNILVTSHTSPDMDSVGSTLSFYLFLKSLNKQVDVYFSDQIPSDFKFLPGSHEVKIKELSEVDFTNYNLLIFLDCATINRVTRNLEPLSIPEDLQSINIDHHFTNDKYAKINLIDNTSSTCELLFNLYKNWNLEVTKDIAVCLLTGMIGDTVSFQYADSGDTLRVAGELVDLGASTRSIALYTLRSTPIEKLKFWSMCLSKMEEKEVENKKYVWAAVNFEEMNKLKRKDLKQGAESFFNSVEGTDFGVLLTEQEKGILSGSFRARTQVDVSSFAQALGGGGHKGAAGFKFGLKDLSFEEGVKKVHDTILESLKNAKTE